MDTSPVYCARCGAANQLDDETCFACGQPLQLSTIIPTSPPQTPNGDQPVSETAAPGTSLQKHYRIISQIGTGGYGAVYKAKDTQDGDRLVAIKEINLRGLKPHEVIEATDTFNRENTLLSGLVHPNLPRVYDHFTDPEHWYLVMDYIEGETLEEYLQKTQDGRLPLETVLDIGIQLCTVLNYLHTRQPPIIFRDLKPANIMRTPDGRVYLIDFGTARHLKPGQARDTIALGSPGYAAPEQYGKAQTTQQSDVYSLGVTLHHLLTGNDPSEGPFRLAPLRSFDASLPHELEKLIGRMVELDIGKRPTSVEEVKQELEAIVFQQSRALYALQPSTPVGQPVSYTSTRTGTAGKQSGSFSSVVRNAVSNAVLVVLVLLVTGGSLFSCFFVASFFHRTATGTVAIPLLPAAPLDKQIYRSPLVAVTDSSILDPALASDTQAVNLVNMVFTGLVSLDDNFRARGQLAASWDISTDGLQWTFHLHPGLRFSDGTPLTSRDVAYSIDRALQPATQSPTSMVHLGLIKDADKLHAGQISTLIGDSIVLLDAITIRITLSKSAQYFLAALAYPCSYVVEKSLLDRYGNQTFTDHLGEGGGAGPFKVAGYVRGQEIDLARNPNHYGSSPQIQKVILPFYKDVEASYHAYQADQVDTTAIPLTAMNIAMERDDFRKTPQSTIYYYAMNYLVKPFNNIHIRQAFASALDEEVLVQTVWKSMFLPTCHIVPEGIVGYNTNLTCPAGILYNPSQAKALLQQGLQEEGWSSVTQLPPITFTYASGSRDFDNEVSAVQQMWKAVLGVYVKTNPVSASTLRKEIAASVNNPHGLQFWAASWTADYPDPEDWTTLQFNKGSPYNAVNYGQNESTDASLQQKTQQQLEAADSNPDPAARLQMYEQAEQQLVNDVAWMPMYQVYSNFLIKPYVTSVGLNSPFAIPPDDWTNIYIAEH